MDTNNSEFDVMIEYCGGWGYASRFRYAKQAIQDSFPGANVEGKKVSGYSGEFEITVKGKKVHSKKRGDGHIDSDNIKNVIKQIEQLTA